MNILSRKISMVACLISLVLISACTSYSSNGQRIFLTGTSSSGKPIVPSGFNMPMMRLTCAGCHGPEGHGGSVVIAMQRYDVPSITWPVLTQDEPPFTEETVKRAIVDGIDADGSDLEYPMPHWQMSSGDLDDLVAFIKTLK